MLKIMKSLNNFKLSFCEDASWKQRATCMPTLLKKTKVVDLTENEHLYKGKT